MTIKHILPSHVHAVIDQQVCFTKGNKTCIIIICS